MGAAKFVVRGGGRWRALELASGRVSGWGGVQFVCVRRGRLQLVPRGPLLSALRRLVAAGAKRPARCAAKDGPRLSQIRYPAIARQSRGRRERGSEAPARAPHTCCQQQHLHCSTDANFNSVLKPPTNTVGVQCSAQASAAVQVTFTDRVTHIPSQTDQQPLTHRDGSEEVRNTAHGSEEIRHKDHGSEQLRSKDHGSEQLRSEDHGSEQLRSKDHGSEQLRSKDHGSEQLRSKDHGSEQLRSKDHGSEQLRRKDRGSERLKRRTLLARKKQAQESTSSDSTAVLATRKKNNVQQDQESSSSDSDFESQRKNELQKDKDHGSEGITSKALSRRKRQDSECKELVISEEIVLLLRNFIERNEHNAWGLDLERYDADDDYKLRVFFQLNPLVKLERCEQITRMLRDRASQADSVSLRDFISTLGLQSVADSSTGQSRYRMRSRRRSDGARDPDKENHEAAPRRARDHARAGRVLEESRPNKRHGNQLNRGQAKTTAERSEPGKRELKEGTREGHAPPTNKRAREYSAAEDAFIVRWVRGEGRARLVNGNRLWRQLQPQHKASTGCARTWHSLRNRYLRYLLPALGALDLPPHEAARLRAAASTGELKARKQPARRNSVFQQPPVRSAWGRRPRPQPPDTVVVSDTEEKTTPTRALRSDAPRTRAHNQSPPRNNKPAPRTPTYSELTRRFARRHRSTPASDTADTTDTSGTTSSDRRGRPTRRSDKRLRSGSSESDTRQPPRRRARQRDNSVQNIDVNGRHNEKTTRSVKTKKLIQSVSLDSDIDTQPHKLRTSSRHADSSDRQVESSVQLADKTRSNRRRTRSQDTDDTDTYNLPLNKRRRIASIDSDRHAATSVQALRRRRTQSLYVETDTSLSGVLRETSADTSERQSRSNTRAADSDRRRGSSGPDADNTDRQRALSAREGVDSRHRVSQTRPRSNADKLLIEGNREGDRSDRRRPNNTQHTDNSGRQSVKSGKTDRHRDTSTQNDKVKGDETDRRKPRARRLYNPNAV